MYVLSYGNRRIPVDFRCIDFAALQRQADSVAGANELPDRSFGELPLDYQCMPKSFTLDLWISRWSLSGNFASGLLKSKVRLPTENREVEIL